MFFRALGPVRVEVAAALPGKPLPQDGTLYLPGHRQQTILAMLIVGVGQTISTGRMIDAIWEDSIPPATARAQVQNCSAAVRRALEQAQRQRRSRQERQVTIATRPYGYRLDADPEATDIGRFERIVRDCLPSSAGRDEEVVPALREGLGLWTGPALGGLAARELKAEADRLEELRLVAMEELACRELRQGTAPELQVAELIALTRRHPEQLAAWACVGLITRPNVMINSSTADGSRDPHVPRHTNSSGECTCHQSTFQDSRNIRWTYRRGLYDGSSPMHHRRLID